MNDAEKAYQYFVIAVPENEEQAKAYFWARKALQSTLTPPNETPPCYQPDGDGCAYQCYDGDDEPIDKCKECPLCYSDKQRHHAPPNEPLTLEQLREMVGNPVYIIANDTGIAEWNVISGKKSITIAYDYPTPGFKSVVTGIVFINGREFRLDTYGTSWIVYRRPPKGEEEHHALPNEPLTQADIDKMHFDRVWIDYGVDDSGERCWEEGVVLYGKLYDIDTLDGSAFEELLLDACDGETLDRPSGDYKVYRRLPGEAE